MAYKDSWIVGIDPGLDGAFAVLDSAAGFIAVHDIDTLVVGSRRQYNVPVIASKIHATIGGAVPVVFGVEKSQPMPKQGVSSTFSIGRGFGVWEGIIGAFSVLDDFKVSYHLISPVTWKRKMLADMPKGKDSSIYKAIQLYPETREYLTRKKDHNRAEALLIADYVRRFLL